MDYWELFKVLGYWIHGIGSIFDGLVRLIAWEPFNRWMRKRAQWFVFSVFAVLMTSPFFIYWLGLLDPLGEFWASLALVGLILLMGWMGILTAPPIANYLNPPGYLPELEGVPDYPLPPIAYYSETINGDALDDEEPRATPGYLPELPSRPRPSAFRENIVGFTNLGRRNRRPVRRPTSSKWTRFLPELLESE